MRVTMKASLWQDKGGERSLNAGQTYDLPDVTANALLAMNAAFRPEDEDRFKAEIVQPVVLRRRKDAPVAAESTAGTNPRRRRPAATKTKKIRGG